MSKTESDTNDSTDAIAIRRAIRQSINAADAITHSDLVDTVGTLTGADADAVAAQLDKCEQNGFVYLVGDDDPEVRLP